MNKKQSKSTASVIITFLCIVLVIVLIIGVINFAKREQGQYSDEYMKKYGVCVANVQAVHHTDPDMYDSAYRMYLDAGCSSTLDIQLGAGISGTGARICRTSVNGGNYEIAKEWWSNESYQSVAETYPNLYFKFNDKVYLLKHSDTMFDVRFVKEYISERNLHKLDTFSIPYFDVSDFFTIYELKNGEWLQVNKPLYFNISAVKVSSDFANHTKVMAEKISQWYLTEQKNVSITSRYYLRKNMNELGFSVQSCLVGSFIPVGEIFEEEKIFEKMSYSVFEIYEIYDLKINLSKDELNNVIENEYSEDLPTMSNDNQYSRVDIINDISYTANNSNILLEHFYINVLYLN